MELPNPELVFTLDSTPYLKGILGILGFAMRNRCFQVRGEGSLLSVSDRAPNAESTIYRAKPNAYLIFSLTILTILSPTITAIFSINSAGEVNPTHEQLISPSTYLSLPSESVSRIKSAVQISGKS